MNLTAVYRGVCMKCGDHIEVGDEIKASSLSSGGWEHVVCPEDDDGEVQFDDRPRCRFCGDLLTPDFECESCPG